MRKFSLKNIYRLIPSQIFRHSKNLMLTSFSKEENEMESFFTKSFHNMDVANLCTLLDNGYQCSELQKSLILNEVQSVFDKLFKTSTDELIERNSQSYSLDLSITNQELFCLSLSFKYNIIDSDILKSLMKFKKIELFFLLNTHCHEKISDDLFVPDKRDFANCFFSFYLNINHTINKYMDIYFNNIKSFLNNSTNFPFLIKDILCETIDESHLDNRFKNHFLDEKEQIKFKPNDIEKINIKKFKHSTVQKQLSFSFFMTLIKQYLYRNIIENDNALTLAQSALNNKYPFVFANIVNFSHLKSGLSPIVINKDNLLQLDKICSNFKELKSDLFSVELYNRQVFNIYKLIQHCSKIFTLNIINNNEDNIFKNNDNQEKLLSFVNQLNDSKNNNIQTLSIDEIIKTSLMDNSEKQHFHNIVNLVITLKKITDLNIEENNFINSIESKIFNIIQLQYSFDFNIPKDKFQYQQNIMEQRKIIFDTIISIRDDYQERQLKTTSEQVEKLLQYNNNKKIMMR